MYLSFKVPVNIIRIRSFLLYPWAQLFGMQCCSCTYHFTWEATYFWYFGLRSVCCGINNYCSTCSSRTWDWVCYGSLGFGYWTRYEWFPLIGFYVNFSCKFNLYFMSSAAFLFYAIAVLAAVFVLIIHFIPHYGQTHIMVYIGVCSLIGSLSVRIYACCPFQRMHDKF